MAFPQTTDPTRHASTTNQANHDVPMPATVPAGALLIACISLDATNPFTVIPSGWTNLGSGAGIGHVFAKVADGSEGGTTPRWQTTSALGWSSHVYLITDWFGSLSGVEAAMDNLATGDPDPPSLTPSWGAADTLWIAYAGQQATETVSSGPTGYSTPIVDSDTSSAAKETSMSCRRDLNAVSDNPSVFDTNVAAAWRAFTIAIRPESINPGEIKALAYDQFTDRLFIEFNGTNPEVRVVSDSSIRAVGDWLTGFSNVTSPGITVPTNGQNMVVMNN